MCPHVDSGGLDRSGKSISVTPPTYTVGSIQPFPLSFRHLFVTCTCTRSPEVGPFRKTFGEAPKLVRPGRLKHAARHVTEEYSLVVGPGLSLGESF